MKLISKKRIKSKIIKIHDSPKTPFQRLIDSPHISTAQKLLLKKQISKLNPFQLRKQIELKLKPIFATVFKKYHS